ncbi:pyrrolysine--tRNA(Pyl) ligase small subunit [Desulforhopalus vacuolatus]|uniref:pyrrolysine--tRNA(Pyl) ligase small subunit n=1 Tax=Desulforhopalus vacuolatus TaxID=40414 RepID=UPI003F6B18E5
MKKRFYRKRAELFNVLNKIKLWPSRKGVLHGIRSIEIRGEEAKITTHCNKEFYQKNSRNSRAGRWLRNKWFLKPCSACRIPEWKLQKYSSTSFQRHQGSSLTHSAPGGKVSAP